MWHYTTNDVVLSTPAIANNILYIGSIDCNIYALDTATDKEVWRYTTGGPVGAAPAIADGVVYVSSNDGNLYAFGSPATDVPVTDSIGWVCYAGAIVAALLLVIAVVAVVKRRKSGLQA